MLIKLQLDDCVEENDLLDATIDNKLILVT